MSGSDGLHLLDEIGTPGRRLERVREVLGHLRDLAVPNLADADVADRDSVAVVDRALDDEDVAAAEHARVLECRARAGQLAVLLAKPECRLLGEPLARLRPLLDEVVGRVLLRELADGREVAALQRALEGGSD